MQGESDKLLLTRQKYEPKAPPPSSAAIQTVAVMVNAVCNLTCPHCDLPRRYKRYHQALAANRWGELTAEVLKRTGARVVSVAAMEPLLPKVGQPKTAAVIRAARAVGATAGLVTNGTYAQDFLNREGSDLAFDFFDVSVDGDREVDTIIRGGGHFEAVERFLLDNRKNSRLGRLTISFALTGLSAEPARLQRFIDWVASSLHEPRLVVLPLYVNQHVEAQLALTPSVAERAFDLLARNSPRFADIFLDVLPGSVPSLCDFVRRGVLPGQSALRKDATGVVWGHIAENLYVRYTRRSDLLRTTLRISPEGHALTPEGFVTETYLDGAIGSLLDEDIDAVLARQHEMALKPDCDLPKCQLCLTGDCPCDGSNDVLPLLNV